MITLAKHIEALLLEHDCVIIPGFGGFLSNQAEATYDQTGGSTLLPPHRTVGFNQQLQINDGLLVQSYMTAYDASYPSAHLQMEKEIEQMKMELDVNGHYNIENVGRLTKGISGQIIFEAQDKDLPSPSLYGLGAFYRGIFAVGQRHDGSSTADIRRIKPLFCNGIYISLRDKLLICIFYGYHAYAQIFCKSTF